jgi:hypothetical protein
MNFIRINWRLNEVERVTHHPFLLTVTFWIIYFTSPRTPTLCIVHYINLFTVYWFVHNSRIVSIFKTHRERSCQRVRGVRLGLLTVTKSPTSPMATGQLDRLIVSLSFVARCMCMEIFFIIYLFIHSHSLIRMWEEVSEWEWAQRLAGELRCQTRRPAHCLVRMAWSLDTHSFCVVRIAQD